MDVNGRTEFRELPRRAGVIEMNVTEKDVPDVLGSEPCPLKLVGQIYEGRFRTRVE